MLAGCSTVKISRVILNGQLDKLIKKFIPSRLVSWNSMMIWHCNHFDISSIACLILAFPYIEILPWFSHVWPSSAWHRKFFREFQHKERTWLKNCWKQTDMYFSLLISLGFWISNSRLWAFWHVYLTSHSISNGRLNRWSECIRILNIYM